MKQFQNVRVKVPQTALHDLSHESKLSLELGSLVPILSMEVLPGDRIRLNVEQFMRTMPMIAPVMHRVNVHIHHWFVPMRLIHNDWENFITGGKTGAVVNMPKIIDTAQNLALSGHFQISSLADYLGVPCDRIADSPGDVSISLSQALFRAYQLVYNAFYRDENLVDEIDIPNGVADIDTTDTAEMAALCTLRQRAFEKDMFTSALPTAQRGNPVTLPLGGSAPIDGKINFKWASDGLSNPVIGDAKFPGASDQIQDAGGNFLEVVQGGPGSLAADLSNATAATITELRTAFALQRWLERSMRSGYRYPEYLKTAFGVKYSDARLQRPQFLGGGKLPISIGEVLQTSETTATSETPLGTMAGRGLSGGNVFGFKHYFEEHGVVISIMSIVPRTGYYQGLPRIFSKFDRFDYFDSLFAHIGEQAVLNKELFLTTSGTDVNEEEFGYQERYVEYRQMPDRLHGEFRDSLKFWTMTRSFSSLPTLSKEFIEIPSDMDSDNFAVSGEHHYIAQLYFDIKAFRKVPRFGDPI